jgi:hypothetical protein
MTKTTRTIEEFNNDGHLVRRTTETVETVQESAQPTTFVPSVWQPVPYEITYTPQVTFTTPTGNLCTA